MATEVNMYAAVQVRLRPLSLSPASGASARPAHLPGRACLCSQKDQMGLDKCVEDVKYRCAPPRAPPRAPGLLTHRVLDSRTPTTAGCRATASRACADSNAPRARGAELRTFALTTRVRALRRPNMM